MSADNINRKGPLTEPSAPEETPEKDLTKGSDAEVCITRRQTKCRLTEASESVEKKQAIIIVCGPPHSGKSVFFTALKQYLPRRDTRLFRACPDGEGTFSQLADADVAQNIRRKGGFTPEFIDFVLKGLGRISQKRVLVDVGGIRSPENAAIFEQATHAVVLCRSDKPEEKQEWEDFCKEHGVVLLASIDSSLTGEESITTDEHSVIRGQIVGLERGEEIKSDTLAFLASQILEDTQETSEQEVMSEADGMRFISLDNLADEMNVPSKGREIKRPDKGYDLTIELPWWTGENIGEAAERLRKLDPQSPMWLDGGHPATLYAATTSVLPNKEIWYTDETNYSEGKGKVETLELSDTPSDTLDWKVEEREDYTLVEVGWKKDVQWKMDNFADFLKDLKIPQVNPNKGVIISGKMAYLIFGSMARTYQSHAQWVGLFAPQQKEDSSMKWPAMVVASKSSEHRVGEYIECPTIGQAAESIEILRKYHFELLDPRPGARFPQAKQHNDTVLSKPVLGIEVTVPELAERCSLGNIDPQHTEGNIEKAAIEAAVDYTLPAGEITMATVRPDLDSIGSMAVLNLRAKGERIDTTVLGRIQKIAESDKFTKGAWPGKQSIPTKENPWPAAIASASDTKALAAIAAAIKDHRKPINKRVGLMEQWLLTGEEPSEYRDRVEAERIEMIEAIKNDDIEIKTIADGSIAVVNSTHRSGIGLGYTQAPVVIAVNSQFSMQGGEKHTKITLAQYEIGHVDLLAIYKELNAIDPAVTEGAKWGGSPTVGGSPQGIASQLDTESVIEIAKKHLIKKSE
ncbi:hypothetical protein GF369_01035 [Candidatus Peregrinibacteria bacterium]|nr:hypothetical protein [Candidatus Peregrinibacteria bacterium]